MSSLRFGAALGLLLLLTACGSSNGSSGSSTTTATTTAGTTTTTGSATTTSGTSAASTTGSTGGINHPPLAGTDVATTVQNTPVVIQVLANDVDPDGDTLHVVANLGTAQHGTVSTDGTTVTYTPNTGFVGGDSFRYAIDDGHGGTASALVNVTVTLPDQAPIANDDNATVLAGQPLTIAVLANDSDPDGDPLSVAAANPAAHGVVSTDGQTVSYHPDTGYTGTDSFTYGISDGRGGSATATVHVLVDAPPVAVDDAVQTDPATPVLIDVLANDSDPEGDALTITSATQPSHGTTALVGNQVRYTPLAGFAGPDAFSYTIADGPGATATAQVSVTVVGPPVANPDFASTPDQQPANIDVLANDSDPNGLPLTLQGVGSAAHGTTAVGSGLVTYTPAPGFLGVDTFSYTVENSLAGVAQGTVKVLVRPASAALRLTAADRRSCAIVADGSLRCWGEEPDSSTQDLVPTAVGSATDWTSVASGDDHVCGVRSGALYCWGYGSFGELGLGSSTYSAAVPTQVGSATTWAQVTSGYYHSCATRTDGTLWCWGWNDDGECGPGAGFEADTPVQVDGANDWAQVSAGYEFTCAVKRDGTLWCWGYNTWGQLGIGNGNSTSTPTQVGTLDRWAQVSAGNDTSCGVQDDGTLWCWGAGYLGLGNQTSTQVPAQVGSSTHWVAVSVGSDDTCGVLDDGSVSCFGPNRSGEAGNGTVGVVGFPTPVAGNRIFVAAAVGSVHACGMTGTGAVSCWGSRQYGKVGDGLGGDQLSPLQLPGSSWTGIGVAGTSTCAVLSGGGLACWGSNSHGELGDGTTAARDTPPATPTATGVGALFAGPSHSCSLDAAGDLSCWGWNWLGALGDGTQSDALSPEVIGLAGPAVQASAGGEHTCAILADQSLWCWGDNSYGQLGDGTTARTSLPEHILAGQSWLSVGAGDDHTCAVRADHTLWCWGSSMGSTPIQVGQGTSWSAVTAGASESCVQKSDGTMWTFANASSPAPALLGSINDWAQFSCGGFTTCGVRSNGTLWCAGNNSTGAIGDGTRNTRASPVQIGTATDWTRVSTYSGYFSGHTCAVRAGGQLYCWGSDGSGELGDGTAWTATPVTAVP